MSRWDSLTHTHTHASVTQISTRVNSADVSKTDESDTDIYSTQLVSMATLWYLFFFFFLDSLLWLAGN